jgi:aminopeptidase N
VKASTVKANTTKAAESSASVGAASAGDPYLPTSGNGGYAVSHYSLELDYRVSPNRLSGTAEITATASQPLTRFSLDLSGLTASKVRVNGVRAARFTQTQHKLVITPAAPLRAGERFEISVRYAGHPGPYRSPWGDVGWEELTEGVIVAGQPCGASTWFPCNDHPGNKATMQLGITTDSPYRVVATGRLVATTVKSSRTRWEFEAREPQATYLASVQIGYYQAHDLPPGGIPQSAYIPGDLADAFASDFGDQHRMLAAFEGFFGPYPFPDYTVVVTDDELEIPLEAHGMSVFGRNHVDGQGGSNRLIAHELAHSWFGNSLTVGSWKDIWLHEGFACYAEWLWSEVSGGTRTERLAENAWSRLKLLPQDFAIGDPGPALMFDDRLYKRGALALHALRLGMGDEPFFGMLRSWTAAKRFGTVTTAEFLDFAAGHSDLPIARLMEPWLYQEALPALRGRSD